MRLARSRPLSHAPLPACLPLRAPLLSAYASPPSPSPLLLLLLTSRCNRPRLRFILARIRRLSENISPTNSTQSRHKPVEIASSSCQVEPSFPLVKGRLFCDTSLGPGLSSAILKVLIDSSVTSVCISTKAGRLGCGLEASRVCADLALPN